MILLPELEGCSLAYDICGEGEPILFIQGTGVIGHGWLPQTAELSTHYSCMTFDNRGVGKSLPVGSAVTVERMSEDALAVMNAAGWDSAHIVGHSLGGLVAVQLALEHRSCVTSLSLLCTFPNGRSAAPLTPRMIWLGMRARIGTRSMRRRGFLQLIMPPGLVAGPNTAEELAELFGHDLADQPPIVNIQLRALRAYDPLSRLRELNGISTLVVSAAHDPIAPPSAGRKLAASIPGAKFLEFADASHGLPITHAQQLNRMLRDHFAATS